MLEALVPQYERGETFPGSEFAAVMTLKRAMRKSNVKGYRFSTRQNCIIEPANSAKVCWCNRQISSASLSSRIYCVGLAPLACVCPFPTLLPVARVL